MNKCEFYLRKCLLKVKDNLLLWLYGEMKKAREILIQ